MNINIDIYLRGAFRELESFSIPRVGTFKKVGRSAWTDDSSSVIYPPSKEIQFDPKIDPDLLLNQYFTDNIQMERSAADQIVGQIQRVILNELETKGKFEIPDIGVLRRNATSELSFQSFDQKNDSFSGDFFGLKPVPFSPPRLSTPTNDTTEIMNRGRTAERSNTPHAIGWKSSLLIALLIALGILIVNQSPFIKHRSSLTQGLKVRLNEPAPFAEKYRLDNLSEVPDKDNETADPSIRNETLLSDSNTLEPKQDVEKPETQSPPLESNKGNNSQLIAEGNSLLEGEQPQTRTRGLGESRGQSSDPSTTESNSISTYRIAREIIYYHLILGSFQDPQRANRFVEQLKDEGYDPVILFPPAGSSRSYKVSVFRSRDRKEVETYGEKLKKTEKKNGWIFEERKTE